MALYPKAIKKLIPPGPNDPRIQPVGMIFHVAVSMADSLHDYFDGPSGGIESHFYVRLDGTVEQYRDTLWEADAQSKGNSFWRDGARKGYISVETEGMGRGQWTPAQMKSLTDLGRWAQKTHKFKKQKCTAWNSDGYGYHAMFGPWNPNNHSCPGPDRIVQFNHELIQLLLAPDKTMLQRRPNLKAALDKLAQVRKHTGNGPLRRQLDAFTRWVKKQ